MTKLLEIAHEYVHLKDVEAKPVMIAMAKLIQICGNKSIEDFDRKDARSFVDGYGKVKTTTIRRRLNSINAVFNWAAYELDLDRRNPFARLIIRGEGRDAAIRQSFSVSELTNLYSRALSFGQLRLILPILGETGCRLSEVLGATKRDVMLVEDYLVLHVHENFCRGLKTRCSERQIPIVSGYAQEAIRRLLNACSDSQYLFPRYARDGYINNTSASATLCKFLKVKYYGKTTHCLRHSFRDRLRDADVPLEAIDQIGGWSSVGGAGARYGMGYSIDKLAKYLTRISIKAQ